VHGAGQVRPIMTQKTSIVLRRGRHADTIKPALECQNEKTASQPASRVQLCKVVQGEPMNSMGRRNTSLVVFFSIH
jgi:hypothetical protein